MNGDRGLDEVEGLVLGAVAVLVLLGVTVAVLLSRGIGASSGTTTDPYVHVVGLVVAILVVLAWFTLERW